MKKRTATAIMVFGIAFFVAGAVGIHQIFTHTREVNSQPEPPNEVIIMSQVPYCQDCAVSNGLAWNALAVIMSIGAIVFAVGAQRYRVITRKGIV